MHFIQQAENGLSISSIVDINGLYWPYQLIFTVGYYKLLPTVLKKLKFTIYCTCIQCSTVYVKYLVWTKFGSLAYTSFIVYHAQYLYYLQHTVTYCNKYSHYWVVMLWSHSYHHSLDSSLLFPLYTLNKRSFPRLLVVRLCIQLNILHYHQW